MLTFTLQWKTHFEQHFQGHKKYNDSLIVSKTKATENPFKYIVWLQLNLVEYWNKIDRLDMWPLKTGFYLY